MSLQMHLMSESHIADLTHRLFVVSQLLQMSPAEMFVARGVELLNLDLHTRVEAGLRNIIDQRA